MSWAHTHIERVRFGDLDALKHLNNVVFLRYFETGGSSLAMTTRAVRPCLSRTR
jgi:acyl-CoA thioesterase FadM